MPNDENKKFYTIAIFVVSLPIFISSLVPGKYFVSSIDLSGAAGVPNNPEQPPTTDPISITAVDSGVSIISGVLSILAALYGIVLTRSEFAKLKAVQIDREMQRQEIEKLRLELELEKQRKQKAKSASKSKKLKTSNKTNTSKIKTNLKSSKQIASSKGFSQ